MGLRLPPPPPPLVVQVEATGTADGTETSIPAANLPKGLLQLLQWSEVTVDAGDLTSYSYVISGPEGSTTLAGQLEYDATGAKVSGQAVIDVPAAGPTTINTIAVIGTDTEATFTATFTYTITQSHLVG